VRRLAMALPEVTERSGREGHLDWRVRDNLFVWERPLRKSDLAALAARGEDAPQEPILGVRVADLGVKEALIADDPEVCFTIPHFDGYSAVLVLLDQITVPALEELIVDAWLARAPKRLAAEFLDRTSGKSRDSATRPG
jgi:hypothetical protein